MKQSETLTPELAPAFFNTKPSPKMTKRYGYFKSTDIVAFLIEEGWSPISFGQKGHNKRTESNKAELMNYSKHYARFRRTSAPPLIAGQLIPELYYLNSHDGSSKLQIETGFLNIVCENGLIVRDRQFGRIDIKHSMNNVKEIKPMLSQFVDNFSNVAARVNDLKKLTLSLDEQVELATIAMDLRWIEAKPKILVDKVLDARRVQDSGNDLWSVYNRIQENLVKGGLEGLGVKKTKQDQLRIIKTRQIKNIDVEISFNTKLWDVVNSKLVSGAFQTTN